MTDILQVKYNGSWHSIPAIKGNDGQDGQGVPTGGTTGQVLAKKTNSDYDTEWIDQSGGTQTTYDSTNERIIF